MDRDKNYKLKLYNFGERVMKAVPPLGNLHHKASQSIACWLQKRNPEHYGDLSLQNPTDDQKAAAAGSFLGAALFGILLSCSIFSLDIIDILTFCLLFCVAYLCGVGALIAPSAETKEQAHPPVVKTEEAPEEKQAQKSIPYLFNLAWTALMIVVAGAILAYPDQVQELAKEYHVYDYLAGGKIGNKNAFAFIAILACLFVMEILGFLFGYIYKLSRSGDHNYSAEKMKHYRETNISLKR